MVYHFKTRYTIPSYQALAWYGAVVRNSNSMRLHLMMFESPWCGGLYKHSLPLTQELQMTPLYNFQYPPTCNYA